MSSLIAGWAGSADLITIGSSVCIIFWDAISAVGLNCSVSLVQMFPGSVITSRRLELIIAAIRSFPDSMAGA